MSGMRLRTVVVDRSALVSLGVPRADADDDTDTAPDPLQYLLTSCNVFLPPEVVEELRDITQYQDIHGAAATNVLAARSGRVGARCWMILLTQVRSRSRLRERPTRRERERADGSVGRCRRKTAMSEHRGGGA